MKVRLKRAYFIDGYRFDAAGIHEIPDRFADRLPKDAEILDGPAEKPKEKPTAEAPKVVKEKEGPPPPVSAHPEEPAKGYRLSPKELKDDQTEFTAPFADAKARALKVYIAEGPRNSVDSWNKLAEGKRKERILAAFNAMKNG